MSNWIHCEECDEQVYASTSDAVTRDTFFLVTTLSGSEVGHYCSAEHAAKGIEAWEQMIADGEAEEAAKAKKKAS